ncbi:MAG TPA: asparagine synthase-related protein [Methanolinea sp.]|nr:asparagine synthase-related protein [Methanolinea sp.]HQK56884.1 asparagine synthase-related protein [Methanolinea sp.]
MSSDHPISSGKEWIRGWVEVAGERLQPQEALSRVRSNPLAATAFGGEFSLSWDGCTARDRLGIVPGPGPAGKITCDGDAIGEVNPQYPRMDLESAIREAVWLRADKGAVALSGGVDSSLVAVLAGLPCLAVGIEGSHDLEKADSAARLLGLDCTRVAIRRGEVEEALVAVVSVIPQKSPVDASIGTTVFFIARAARDLGSSRVLTGQGADELFGGYARYLTTGDIESQLVTDFATLGAQADRDQAVAALHGVLLSLPYLDLRVVNAAKALPPERKVIGNLRKVALREVAERYMPRDLAWREKKAMQYGSGVAKEIRRLSRRKGYTRMGDYIGHLAGKHI